MPGNCSSSLKLKLNKVLVGVETHTQGKYGRVVRVTVIITSTSLHEERTREMDIQSCCMQEKHKKKKNAASSAAAD